MRLGILGGTFNPVHLGHLRAAEEIGEYLKLERVYLVPSGMPPHKNPYPLTEFFHRLEMTKRAIEISPLLDVWGIEGERKGPSFSIDTLKMFHQRFGAGLELFFIMGTDAFMEIHTWKEFRDLFGCTSFVIINRPGYNNKKDMFAYIESIDAGLAWNPEKECFTHPSGNILIKKAATMMDISASRIRDLVGKGKSVRFLVPETVRKYIEEEGLYLTK